MAFRRIVLASLLGCTGAVAAVPARVNAPPTEKEFETSRHNLKRIVIGMYNYASTFEDVLPGNFTSKDGKPLLSWRVALLPFLEEEKLFLHFKLDEAWDGPHNKKLIAKMPKIYAPVRGTAKPGETFYQVFAGPKAVFGTNNKADLTKAFPDGLSNTGLVYEAGEPVVWTKPQDLPFDESKPLPKLGGLFDGELHVALADGTVIRCFKEVNEKEMKLLIMPADGIAPPDFKKLKLPDVE